MPKIPYFPFYPADWLSSNRISLLKLDEEAIYMRLLCVSWTLNGILPLDVNKVCQLARLHLNRKKSVTNVLNSCFICGTNGYTNDRQMKEICLANERHLTAKKGHNSRKNQETCSSPTLDESCANQNQNQNQKEPPIPPKGVQIDERFNSFWKVYPKKTAKATAIKAWRKITPKDELFEKIMRALETQKKSDQWQKDSGQFIPHPATWLNQHRWEDELEIQKGALLHGREH